MLLKNDPPEANGSNFDFFSKYGQIKVRKKVKIFNDASKLFFKILSKLEAVCLVGPPPLVGLKTIQTHYKDFFSGEDLWLRGWTFGCGNGHFAAGMDILWTKMSKFEYLKKTPRNTQL